EAIELYLRLLLPLAPALLCAQAVAEEIDAKTHAYLWARPAPRAALLLGKGAMGTLTLLPAFLAGGALAYGVSMARDAGRLGAEMGRCVAAMEAVALGVPLYAMLALGVGSLFLRRPLLACFLYILAVEELVASLPGALKVVSMSFYLRALAGLSLGP